MKLARQFFDAPQSAKVLRKLRTKTEFAERSMPSAQFPFSAWRPDKNVFEEDAALARRK